MGFLRYLAQRLQYQQATGRERPEKEEEHEVR